MAFSKIKIVSLQDIGIQDVSEDDFFSPDALSNRSVIRLDVLPPEQIDVQSDFVVRKHFPNKNSLMHKYYLRDKSYKSFPLYFIRFKNVFVFPHKSIVMIEPGVFVKENLEDITGNDVESNISQLKNFPHFDINNDGAYFDVDQCDQFPQITERCLLVNDEIGHYGHWHIDSLYSIYGIRSRVFSSDTKILSRFNQVNPEDYCNMSFFRDSLSVFGLSSRLIGTLSPVVFCRDVIISSQMMTGGTHALSSIYYQMTKEISHYISDKYVNYIKQPEYIFLMRRGGGGHGRFMKNEEDLAENLRSLGFSCFCPDGFSYEDEVKVFGKAKIVICQSGSAIFNSAFAPEGCIICEIGTGDFLSPIFERASALTKKRYAFFHIDDVESHLPPDNKDYRISNFSFEVPVKKFLDFTKDLMDIVHNFHCRNNKEGNEIEKNYGEIIAMNGPFSLFANSSQIAYVFNIQKFLWCSDSMENGYRSPLRILEDGKPIGHPHCIHKDIMEIGEGRYSHWNSYIVFSASDNSDPNTNGRTYSIYFNP